MDPDLTQDEYTCLLIAAQGASMIPIGRWELPVIALHSRGLLRKLDDVNYVINDVGHAAVKAREGEDDRALGQVFQKVARAPQIQQDVSGFAEQAAHHLVSAAKASAVVSGQRPEDEAMSLSHSVLRRAVELIRGDS